MVEGVAAASAAAAAAAADIVLVVVHAAATAGRQCFKHSVPVLATSSVIDHILYRCSPRHPPHIVPVLATSSTDFNTLVY